MRLLSVRLSALMLVAFITVLGQDRKGLSPQATTSPFTPPKANDYTFVLDSGTGLDTGCTYRSGGPLKITLPIGRVFGDLARLKANGLLPSTVRFEFPAYDVDSSGGSSTVPNERDRVSFNGHVVPGEFLTGLNNTWVMQRFDVPFDWLNLPSDPDPAPTVVPANNTIQIDIDTLSTTDNWCTAVDWVAVTVANPIPPRPWIGVHGIFSHSSIWNVNVPPGDCGPAIGLPWVPLIQSQGVPATAGPDMGSLDTIGNNAAKISLAVNAALKRWGVDRVNIMAHSKGGLDSREYIGTQTTVENLVQLGTPNAGSPLADWVEGGSLVAGGALGSFGANELAGGLGGYELTRPYMAIYNRFFSVQNPEVRYISVGGVETPGGLIEDPTGNVFQEIVGTGDLIVPLSSAFALSYAIHKEVDSSFANDHLAFGEASHTCIHHNADAFAFIRPLVVTAPGKESRAVPQPQATPANTQLTKTFGGRLAAGQSATYSVAVDSGSSVAFALLYSGGDADVTLKDPSGQTYSPSAPPSTSTIAFTKSAIPGGNAEVWTFTGPLSAGTWTATVKVNAAPAGSTTVDTTLNALIVDSPVSMTAAVNPLSVPLGGSFTITARLTNGSQPITGATVTAYTGLVTGSARQTIVLHDDGQNGDASSGDGVYSAVFGPVSQAGAYAIAVDASGTATLPFSREVFLSAFVTASSSQILAAYKDLGRDSNSNGLYDALVLQVPVKITVNGQYRLAATLKDSAGNVLETSGTYTLTTNSTVVELLFDGAALNARGVNGPYTITSVRIAEFSNDLVLPLMELTTPYTTAAYKFTQFEGGGLSFTGTGSAVGVDTNANGKYDRLDVTLGVNILTAGSYTWSGRLRDAGGTEIALASGSGSLAAGTGSILLSFTGTTIGAAGLDGPYQVTDLLLYSGSTSVSKANALTTGPLTASQFEGYVPIVRLTTASAVALFNSYSAYTVNLGDATVQTRTLTLTGSTGALAYVTSVTGTPVFVTASPATGTTPATVVLSINPAGLNAGTYLNTVLFSSGTVTASYTVSLTVQPTGAANTTAKVSIFRQTPPAGQPSLFLLDRNADGICCSGDLFGTFGQAGDIPLAGNWTGSTGAKKVALYRPSQGLFLMDMNGNGLYDAGDKALTLAPQAGDLPVVGDWTGSGVDRVGVFRPATGTWYLDVTGDGSFVGRAFLGQSGDVPLVGNWNGVGTKSKVGIYRPNASNGQPGNFFLVDTNGDGQYTAADQPLFFLGQPGDLPLVGDWSGNGSTKVGIYRPGGSNAGMFILDADGSFSWSGPGVDKVLFFAPYLSGTSTTTLAKDGDLPVTGNWAPSYTPLAAGLTTGQGKTRVGLYRPGTGTFFLDSIADGTFQGRAFLGQSGDLPIGFPVIVGGAVLGVNLLGNY